MEHKMHWQGITPLNAMVMYGLELIYGSQSLMMPLLVDRTIAFGSP